MENNAVFIGKPNPGHLSELVMSYISQYGDPAADCTLIVTCSHKDTGAEIHTITNDKENVECLLIVAAQLISRTLIGQGDYRSEGYIKPIDEGSQN